MARLLPTPSARVPAQYYVIQSGDTLGAIAVRFATTVDSCSCSTRASSRRR